MSAPAPLRNMTILALCAVLASPVSAPCASAQAPAPATPAAPPPAAEIAPAEPAASEEAPAEGEVLDLSVSAEEPAQGMSRSGEEVVTVTGSRIAGSTV